MFDCCGKRILTGFVFAAFAALSLSAQYQTS